MSFQSLQVNMVTVARPTVAYTKGVSTKTYTTVATLVRCNIQFQQAGGAAGMSAGVQQTIEYGYENIGSWWASFEYGANVQKDDRLTDEKSRVFIVKTAPVDVVGRIHHVEVMLSIQE